MTYKMFLGVDSTVLLTELGNEEANNRRVPVSITRTSPFTGALADFLVVFTKKKL